MPYLSRSGNVKTFTDGYELVRREDSDLWFAISDERDARSAPAFEICFEESTVRLGYFSAKIHRRHRINGTPRPPLERTQPTTKTAIYIPNLYVHVRISSPSFGVLCQHWRYSIASETLIPYTIYDVRSQDNTAPMSRLSLEKDEIYNYNDDLFSHVLEKCDWKTLIRVRITSKNMKYFIDHYCIPKIVEDVLAEFSYPRYETILLLLRRCWKYTPVSVKQYLIRQLNNEMTI